MADIEGYTTDKLIPLEESAIVDGRVSGDDLILKRKGGGELNAGNVRGPVGDAGPDGDLTTADFYDTISDLVFSSWVSVSATQFRYSQRVLSHGWVAPRFRYNASVVEFDGLLRYIGPNLTWNWQPENPTESVLVNIPAIPSHVQFRMMHTIGRYPVNFRYYEQYDAGKLAVEVAAGNPTLYGGAGGQWLSLTGLSFRLD